MRITWLHSFSLLVALTPLAAQPAPDAPRPGTVHLAIERIALAGGGFAEADRGVIFVPTVRADPASRPLSVEFYRFRALEKRPDTPPIFRLFGGPGFGGLGPRLEEQGYYEENVVPLIRLADLVIVGQRGIGSSRPDTVCEAPPPVTFPEPLDPDRQEQAWRDASRRCREFWEGRGLDLRGLNVVEAAGDVEDVRRALGYDKIQLWGGSFGSHWAMAVMRFYPGSVARAVLRGMEGPDHTYDSPSWVLQAVERFAAAAEQSEALAPLVPEEGLIGAWKAVLERAEKEPLQVKVVDPKRGGRATVPVSADNLRSLALGYTRRVSSRRGIRSWPSDVLRLFHGDYTGLAQAYLRQLRSNGFPTAAFFMLDCGSGISRVRGRELRMDPAARLVGPLGRFYDANCPVWGADLGEDFRRNFRTSIPTVIVQGDWDTSTPYENALELRPYFENSRFVTVEGGSHGAMSEAMNADSSFQAAIEQFFRNGDWSSIPEKVVLPPLEWVVPNLPRK